MLESRNHCFPLTTHQLHLHLSPADRLSASYRWSQSRRLRCPCYRSLGPHSYLPRKVAVFRCQRASQMSYSSLLPIPREISHLCSSSRLPKSNRILPKTRRLVLLPRKSYSALYAFCTRGPQLNDSISWLKLK